MQSHDQMFATFLLLEDADLSAAFSPLGGDILTETVHGRFVLRWRFHADKTLKQPEHFCFAGFQVKKELTQIVGSGHREVMLTRPQRRDKAGLPTIPHAVGPMNSSDAWFRTPAAIAYNLVIPLSESSAATITNRPRRRGSPAGARGRSGNAF
jgi:hypothetical protein